MTEKKTKSKVGGTRIRQARKPSIIAIIVLGLLSLGAAAWLIYQSFAGTTGAFNVFIYRDGSANVASNLGVTIKNVGSGGSCSSGFNSTGTWNGEWQGTINYSGTINRIISGCNTGSNGNKVFQIVNANTTGNGGYIFTGAQVSYNGGAFQNMVSPYQFVVYDGSDANKTRVIINYNSPPPPPPPPTPSGCGPGTLNDRCATIDGYSYTPATVPYGGVATISWQSTNANRCNIGWGSTGSGWQQADGTYRVGPLTSMYNYVLTCEPSYGGSTPARNMSIPVSGAPTSSLSASSTNIAYNATTTLTWNSTNAASCNLSGGPGAPGGVGLSGSWTTPKLTSGANYSLSCSNSVPYAASPKTVGITVGGAPPPPLPDGCGAGTKNNKCGGSTGGGGGTTSKPPTIVKNTAPTAAGDSTRPSAPGNLKAEENSGAVELTWDASTDDSGIAGYVIERSTDNKTWETLNDGVTDTTYTDSDANFSTLYYYRVSAKDNNGNVSDYAIAEITTGAFEANAFKDSDSTITSEDGVVVAKIPAGALSEDAACEIVIDEESQQALGDKKLLHGPYKLVCKKKDGSTFDKFDKPITYELTVSDEAKKQNPALYGFADNQWTNSNIEYIKDAPNFTFESDVPAPFAVLSESSFPWLWLILLLLLIAALVAGFVWWRKRNSDEGPYVGAGYNPSTMYGDASASTTTPASAPGEMTIPAAPPTPESSQAPGQHQIDVKPTPVHNPALEHHSPLDRLNEMEAADTKADIPGDLTAPGDTSAGGVQPKEPGK